MVVCGWVELLRGVRGFGRVASCIEPGQIVDEGALNDGETFRTYIHL